MAFRAKKIERSFGTRLNEAMELVPLTSMDPRLDQNSDIEPIKSNLKRSQQFHSTCGSPSSPPVHTAIKGIREAVEAPAAPPQQQAPQAPPSDEITQDDLPPLEGEAPQQGGGQDQGQQGGGGLPNGGDYTTQNAKEQIDGILKNWLDLAGQYPEGDLRHNFLEIGERLREISGVLHRDFLGGAEESDQVRPPSGTESPVAGPSAGLAPKGPAPQQPQPEQEQPMPEGL